MYKSKLCKGLTFFILLVLITSCSEEENINCKLKSQDNFQLHIYDSITIENYAGFWYFTDATDNLILGFDLKASEIILINLKTTEVTTINRFGEGPGEYNSIKGVSFFNDSTIVVLDDERLLFYNTKGLPLKSYNLSPHISMIGWNFLFNVPVYLNGSDTNVIVKEYNRFYESGNLDKVYWLTNIDISEKHATEMVPYQPHNYMFKNKSERFPDPVPYFAYSKENQRLIIKYQYEKYLELYELKGFKYTEKIELCPDFFDREAISRKINDQIRFFENEQRNASFVKLVAPKGAVITEYKTRIPEHRIVQTRAEFEEYQIEKLYRDRYALCVLDNDSITKDIPLLWHGLGFTIFTANSMDQVFLKKLTPLSETEETTFKLYIGRFTNESN